MTQAAYEFRVLTGVHADARCPVADTIRIGRHPDGDVVLADAAMPETAQVRVADGQWHLAVEGAPESSQALNQPVELGGMWVTVATPESAWPAVPMTVPTLAAAPESPSVDTPIAADVAALAGTPAPPMFADEPPPSQPDQAIAPKPRRRLLVPLALAFMVLAVAIALLLLALPASKPAIPVAQATRPDPAAQSMVAVEQALERLGLRPALQVSRGADGVVRVTGWVRDREEEERVADAMARIWPMPAMRLHNRAEIAQTARTLLASHSYRYVVTADDTGNLHLRGIAADGAHRTRALDVLRDQLPGVGIDSSGVVLAHQVSDALYEALAQNDLQQVRLLWQTDRLEPTTDGLDPAAMQRLRKLVAGFNERYLDIIALPAQAEPAPVAQAPVQVATTVPFRIRSVVGGPQPFLVLGDGTKLVPGGRVGRYRLSAIENNRIVFDQPHATVVAR